MKKVGCLLKEFVVALNRGNKDYMSEHFYRNIPTFSAFEELTNFGNYQSVPEDWVVIITDVVGSTKAIENGRYFLRATNNGISAIIDNRGKVISRSPQFKEHTLNSDVKLFIGTTPYSKYGNTFLLLFCTLFLFINLILNRKFNKKVII